MLVAAPSLHAAAGGPFAGEAHLTWAYAGASASLGAASTAPAS